MRSVNWERVRTIMERSIRGTRPNDEEADDLDDAWCMLGLPGIVRVRDHECRCGAKWTARVKLSPETPNLSGEETPWCSQCGKRASSSSPWRYVRDEGEPAAAALPPPEVP